MKFADTAYFLALLNPRDRWHALASKLSQPKELTVSTEWVMVELGNAMSASPLRQIFVAYVGRLHLTRQLKIIPATGDWYAQGFELYRRRPDKEWSLTDCISFLVMQERGIADALTSDRHFAQAGFQVLLK